MRPCESNRACQGKHLFCGGGDPVCALCLKTRREIEEVDDRSDDYCRGTFDHRHRVSGGECLGCGKEM